MAERTAKLLASELATLSPAQIESLPQVLVVSVESPCTGLQTITKQSDTLYAGATGDFSYCVLYTVNDGGSTSWELKIWDYRPTSPCFGITYFRLDPPSADPIGVYCDFDGVDKDCDRGKALVDIL